MASNRFETLQRLRENLALKGAGSDAHGDVSGDYAAWSFSQGLGPALARRVSPASARLQTSLSRLQVCC